MYCALEADYWNIGRYLAGVGGFFVACAVVVDLSFY
jgi:hypothetical protein